METNLPSDLLREIQAAFEKIGDLPFPIHASDVAGNFLFANALAQDFFGFSKEQNLVGQNIGPFYEDAREREDLLRKMRKIPAGQWRQNLTVRLLIGGEHRKTGFSSRPFFDENHQLQALLCISDSMSDIEWFAEFGDTLHVGFFELDNRMIITDCNQTFADILNYKSPAELKGRSPAPLFWEEEQARPLLNEVSASRNLKDRQIKLRRSDGAMVIVRANCTAVSGEIDDIFRIKGTIRDITFEIIQEDLPVGLFLVNMDANGKEIISSANQALANIFGYETPDAIRSTPVRKLHVSQSAIDEYKNALDKAAQEDQPLLDFYTEMLDRGGNVRNVVINARYVPGENQHLRVGAIYDVTDHVSKQKRTLEDRFSAVLHTYLATINGLRDTLNMLIKAHGHGVLKEGFAVDRSKAAGEINGHKKRLGDLLTELEKTASERNIELATLSGLQKGWRRLAASQDNEKDNAAWTRRNLIEMRKSLGELGNLNFSRELVREVRTEIDDIQRLCSLVSLSIAVGEITERIPEFRHLRDYLLRGKAENQDFSRQNVLPVLMGAIQHLEEFAAEKHVSVRLHFNAKETIEVDCNKTTLQRAFHSLLHNAIKYSWRKSQDKQPWVDIRLEKRAGEIEFVIENWGVPIRKEELENNRIFEFGKRGREADDRGRSGTGIGLYDANDILKKHRGSLRLTSEPVFGNLAGLYSNPYITRAYITLPTTRQL